MDDLEPPTALPAPDEADLVRRAKSREAQVWSQWYDQYYGPLYRYAFSRLSSREDAEDIAAQVFVEALKGIDGYKYRGRPILAWLYRIAHNLVAARYRKIGRASPVAGDGPAADDPEAALDSLVLREMVGRLTPDQREIVTLRFFAGLSTAEIARVLDKKEATVYSIQVRAVAALRRLLAPDPENFPAGVRILSGQSNKQG
jgi:RNA polymerase sigma-70 factor (ECF subfamily)